VAADRKRQLLTHLVKANDWKQVLVFCKTKHGANRLAQQLSREGVNADAIHGNKSQNARIRALEQFKEGQVRVLVATDIAARGLDIEALPHVVNYDLPHVAEDYVHRIGRTGRAGAEGEAVSLVSPEDRPLMAAIERLMNRKVEQRVAEGFESGSAAPQPQQAPQPRQREQPRHSQQPRQAQGQKRRRGGQPQGSRNPRPQPERRNDQPQGRRNGQRHERFGRRGSGGGYISPELKAQMEYGRKLARQDLRDNPVEPAERAPQPEPAPRAAPTVTHRVSRIRRALGALLGGNKNESGT
jgi:ATP-dependent RNA helicase RhlE